MSCGERRSLDFLVDVTADILRTWRCMVPPLNTVSMAPQQCLCRRNTYADAIPMTTQYLCRRNTYVAAIPMSPQYLQVCRRNTYVAAIPTVCRRSSTYRYSPFSVELFFSMQKIRLLRAFLPPFPPILVWYIACRMMHRDPKRGYYIIYLGYSTY
jgi:hypothetical protein